MKTLQEAIDSRHSVRHYLRRQFSLVGYTAIDLGKAKLHFEIGAGTAFSWE
jgi:hypothetical protein